MTTGTEANNCGAALDVLRDAETVDYNPVSGILGIDPTTGNVTGFNQILLRYDAEGNETDLNCITPELEIGGC